MKQYRIFADREIDQKAEVVVEASTEAEALELAKAKFEALTDDDWDHHDGTGRSLNIHYIESDDGRAWNSVKGGGDPSIEDFSLEGAK